jgi:hypothetical protein
MLKHKLLQGVALAAIAITLAGNAYAQTSNANAGANSSSGSASQSNSASGARASGNSGGNSSVTFNSPGETRSTNTSTSSNSNSVSGGTNNRDAVTYSGGTSNYQQNHNTGDQTIRTTPTVYAPPVSGGNPCTLAVSGGVSVIGWGAAAGGTFVDEDCATRQKIAMIHNAGYAGAAKELMCNDKATYYAFRSSGQPCQPRAAFDGTAAPAPQPMVQQQPTPIVAPAPVPVRSAGPPPRCNPARGIVDNCYSG